MVTPAEPITIKRYAGRRRYNPGMVAYLSFDELAAMVEDGAEFAVSKADTGEDVTLSVLKQIILQRGSHG